MNLGIIRIYLIRKTSVVSITKATAAFINHPSDEAISIVVIGAVAW